MRRLWGVFVAVLIGTSVTAFADVAPDGGTPADAGAPAACTSDPRWAAVQKRSYRKELVNARRQRQKDKMESRTCKVHERAHSWMNLRILSVDGARPKNDVERWLRQYAGHFRSCKDPLGGPSRRFEGSAVLAACIGNDGRVDGVRVLQTDLPRDAVACLQRRIEGPPLHFSESNGPNIVVLHLDFGESRPCYVPSGRI